MPSWEHMAASLRPRAIPHCSGCLRSYAFASPTHPFAQQVRGKKKMAKGPNTLLVRLLKNVTTFGKAGSIVPVSAGLMRNRWFPTRVADYVTWSEQRQLRLKNAAVERDFEFGVTGLAEEAMAAAGGAVPADVHATASTPELQDASMFQKNTSAEVKKLSPERSAELIEIFVPARLEFYRQPIIEEATEPEQSTTAPLPPKQQRRRGASSAADDLMVARSEPQPEPLRTPSAGPQAIYGSVSTHDVLTAIRAVMGHNDEAAKVVLQEGDIHFVDLPKAEGEESHERVKHVGEFVVEVKTRGMENAARRLVKVIAQEA